MEDLKKSENELYESYDEGGFMSRMKRLGKHLTTHLLPLALAGTLACTNPEAKPPTDLDSNQIEIINIRYANIPHDENRFIVNEVSSWDPDSNQIIFEYCDSIKMQNSERRWGNLGIDIYAYDITNRRVENLTNTGFDESNTTVSQDKIIYLSNGSEENAKLKDVLWVMDIDGGNKRLVDSNVEDFKVNGDYIVYNVFSHAKKGLLLFDMKKTTKTTISPRIAGVYNFSYEGKKIVYLDEKDGTTFRTVFNIEDQAHQIINSTLLSYVSPNCNENSVMQIETIPPLKNTVLSKEIYDIVVTNYFYNPLTILPSPYKRTVLITENSDHFYLTNIDGTQCREIDSYMDHYEWLPNSDVLIFFSDAYHSVNKFEKNGIFAINSDGTNLKKLIGRRPQGKEAFNYDGFDISPNGRYIAAISHVNKESILIILELKY